MDSAVGGGGVVQADLVGGELGSSEQCPGVCVGALVGGGEVQ